MWFWPGQAQNQVDSLIHLLYIAHDHDLQAAVDDVTEILRNAVHGLTSLAATGLFEDIAGE